MQNYNVGDRVCLFGSSDPDGSSDGRQLANRGSIVRVLPRRIHCPSSHGDVVQGIICHPILLLLVPDSNSVGRAGRSTLER